MMVFHVYQQTMASEKHGADMQVGTELVVCNHRIEVTDVDPVLGDLETAQPDASYINPFCNLPARRDACFDLR
ncbi:MAG TPA: hypothetical protein VFN25_06535, partial [Dokdonella sp.]|uniref:hypothetical protein n=1 Tax=Dokdonella sp. TaxID=2291710 RepID=UPI002D7EAC17